MSDRADEIARNCMSQNSTLEAIQSIAAALRTEIEAREKAEADLFEADIVIARLNGGAELQAIMADHNAALARVKELEAALRMILSCTPHSRDGAVIFDCGDPYEIARAALEDKP